jgi:hypothetical protein
MSLSSELYDFIEDFALRAEDWNTECWSDITIVQLARLYEPDDCLVLWRYGKAIPGSGHDRETRDGYSIYQRIGYIKHGFSERLSPDKRIELGWDKADTVTIALE